MGITPSKTAKRLILCASVVAAGLASAATSAAATPASWLSAVSGNWTDGTKWSLGGGYPNNGGTTYEATVDAAGSAYTVTVNSAVTIDRLTLGSASAAVRQTSNTFTLLQGLTINSGAFQLAGGTLVTPSISGAGTFTFDGNNAGTQFLRPAAGETLTIAAGATVRTLLGSGTVGRTDGSVVNNGTLIADAGRSISLLGPFDNNGTIQVNGGSIVFKSALTTAELGTIVNTGVAGGLLQLEGALDNTGATLALNSTTGPLSLSYNSSITGGTISGSGTGGVVVPVGTPSLSGGVTVAGSGLTVQSSGVLKVIGGLTLDSATVVVGTNSTFNAGLHFDGTQTLGGTGEVQMNGRGTIKQLSGALTIGSGVTIRARGFYDQIGDSPFALTNAGTITSETGSSFLDIKASNFQNAGTLSMGAGYNTIENMQNTGTLNVSGAGSTQLLGGWHNGGVINVNNGILEMGGNFTLADIGTLNRTGGAVRISGTLDNTGNTLALNAATGSWFLRYGGTIKGGTIATSGGATLEFDYGNNPGGSLDGVTVASNLTIPHAGKVTVRNGLTLNNASMTLNVTGSDYGTDLRFDGTQTLGGTGEIIMSGPYGTVTQSSGTLTIGPNITVRAAGSSGGGKVGENDNSPLINQGTIFSNMSGGTITVRGSTVTNTGTIKSSTGAYLTIYNLDNQGVVNAAGQQFSLWGNWHNSGTITTTAVNTSLWGTFAPSDLGNFTRTGGNLNISGTLNNGGNTTSLGIFNGPVKLTGTIIGGTVTTAAGSPLSIENGTLNGVTLDCDATLTGGGVWRIENGLTLPAGRKIIFSGGEELNVSASTGISGGGEVQIASSTCEILATSSSTFTIGSGITVKTTNSTAGVEIGSASGSLVNNGTLWLNSTSGYLSLTGNFINNGAIRVDAGNLNLGGTDSLGSWGTIIRNGGSVNIIGTFNNAGQTLDLANTPVGAVNIGLGVMIHGGTITSSSASIPKVVRSSSTSPYSAQLDNVTLATSLDIQAVPVDLFGTLTLSGNPNIRIFGSGGTTSGFTFFGNGAINGTGTISFETASSTDSNVRTLSGALTIAPDITIRTVTSQGYVYGSPLTNNGTLSAQAAGKSLIIDGGFTNNGTVEARNGGIASVSALSSTSLSANTLKTGKWKAYASSSINLNGKTFTTNNASILLDGAGSSFAAAAPLNNNGGTFEIDHGRNFTTVSSLANSGTLRIGQGSTLTVNGTLTNTGKIKGKGTVVAGNVNSSGTIEPGESPGTLTINGNLTQLAGSMLDIEIAGSGPGEFDILNVNGTANLGGALRITLLDGYVPPVGTNFDFLTAIAMNGSFDQVIVPTLPGHAWDTSGLSSGHIATMVPEPIACSPLVLAAAAGLRRRRRA